MYLGSDQLSGGRTFRETGQKWSRGGSQNTKSGPGGGQNRPPRKWSISAENSRNFPEFGVPGPEIPESAKILLRLVPGLKLQNDRIQLIPPPPDLCQLGPPGPGIWPDLAPGARISRNWDPPQARWSESGVSWPGGSRNDEIWPYPGESGQIPGNGGSKKTNFGVKKCLQNRHNS